MLCEPTTRDDMVSVATPDALIVTAPRAVVPCLNVTVPVGVPPAVAETVAVRVID
jgi:hypothetical protein